MPHSFQLNDIPCPAPSLAHQKPRPKWYHRIWFQWFTAYRLLSGLTIVVNLAILIIWLRSNLHSDLNVDVALSDLMAATSTNFFVAVLIRQEHLINISFSLVSKTPLALPLWARKIIADFHHYGGIHVGCALSALAWYGVFVGFMTVDTVRYVNREGWLWADIVTCYAFLLSILIICVTAIPRLRVLFHNTFEHTHRFGGWVALLVLWVHAGIGTKARTVDRPLYQSASIWLLAAATLLIILPWLRLHRVPVCAETISSREVKLTFPYTKMSYTCTTRFSLNPLMEWHAFATIPSPDGFAASIIISQAGDWTKAISQDPPQEIWIRNPPTANFLTFAPLFNSVLLVATGAGIGPLLSLLQSPAIRSMRNAGKRVHVMWCVYDPYAPHWAFVQDIIRSVDPMPSIFDSREVRPDLAFEARRMKQLHDIEAVMVVSNQKVTNEVVQEIKAHGGAAYGAVFDS